MHFFKDLPFTINEREIEKLLKSDEKKQVAIDIS